MVEKQTVFSRVVQIFGVNNCSCLRQTYLDNLKINRYNINQQPQVHCSFQKKSELFWAKLNKIKSLRKSDPRST